MKSESSTAITVAKPEQARGRTLNKSSGGFRSAINFLHARRFSVLPARDSILGEEIEPWAKRGFNGADGLWTAFPVRDDLIIHVGIDRLEESSPHGRLLALFLKKPLHFHKDARLRPDPKHFEWHRKKHGF